MPTGADARDRFKWWTVFLLWFAVFFNYADRLLISGVVPLIRKEFGLDQVEVGTVLAAFALTYGLFSPLAGRLVDRLRLKTSILGGLHLWSLISIATVYVRGHAGLLVARYVHGISQSAYFPGAVKMISAYHDRSRSRALGIHQTGIYVGIIAGTTGAAVIGQRYGWRAAFMGFGVCGIAVAIVLQFFLREPHERYVRAVPLSQVIREIVFRRTSLLLVLAFICSNAAGSVLFGWMPTHIYDKFGISLTHAGFYAAMSAQSGSLIGALIGGWSADRAREKAAGGRIVVQAVGLGMAMPFVVLSGIAPGLAVTLAGCVGWGMFKSVYEANIFASMFDVMPPEVRGSVVGTMNMAAWMLGASTAPIVIGYIAKKSSMSIAIASASSIYAVGLILLLCAMRSIARDMFIEPAAPPA
jgi:predicted MFS family arabinose efflux permease